MGQAINIQHCSFCKKTVDDIVVLVNGPGVSICDECVQKANSRINNLWRQDAQEEETEKAKEHTCKWFVADKKGGCIIWESECGHSFYLARTLIEERKHRYCQYCGGRIIIDE